MDDKFNSHIKNGTFTLVPRPTSHNVLSSRWVYKTKLQANGSIEKLKAHWVVLSFFQIPGVDYHKTFAPFDLKPFRKAINQ